MKRKTTNTTYNSLQHLYFYLGKKVCWNIYIDAYKQQLDETGFRRIFHEFHGLAIFILFYLEIDDQYFKKNYQ